MMAAKNPDCVNLKSFATIVKFARRQRASGIGASPASEGAESPAEERGDGEKVRARARRRYDIARCKLQFCCEIIIKYIMPSRLLPQPLLFPILPFLVPSPSSTEVPRAIGRREKRRRGEGEEETKEEERRGEERSGAASR